jgi:integrase
MFNGQIPELTFARVAYGNTETPWDLRPLLYRGGAAANVKKVAALIAQGKLGAPILDRLPLVQKFHEEVDGNIAGGGSQSTAFNCIWRLRTFYAWADGSGRSPTVDSVERDFIEYTEHLLHRERVERDFTSAHAYAWISALIDKVLDRRVPLLAMTRVTSPGSKKKVLGTQADKQNLQHTFAFGHALLDITDALTVEAIQGKLPVKISFRSGQVFEDWCRLRPMSKVKGLSDSVPPSQRRRCNERRAARDADTSHRVRYPLINLRVEAELLIFVAQTGMNLAQAESLKMGKFRYQSHLDGYKVFRVYKGRRGGEVEFEIYGEYRQHFDRYLEWREAMISDNDNAQLFPFVSPPGRSRNPKCAAVFTGVRDRCRKIGIKSFRPRALRMTRVNWLLRHTRDEKLTAEMAQHTQETLLRNYEQPHHQVAVIEISRFHASSDPAISMPGPGLCVEAIPKTLPDSPPHAAKPDCMSPAGCLFCEHQRDIDSFDHVWSLATYRYLKSLELARHRPSAKGAAHPAEAVVERIVAKLRHFEASSKVRALWVIEGLDRISEGDYHPKWDGFIRLLEVHHT